jgi:hypothetical protein
MPNGRHVRFQYDRCRVSTHRVPAVFTRARFSLVRHTLSFCCCTLLHRVLDRVFITKLIFDQIASFDRNWLEIWISLSQLRRPICTLTSNKKPISLSIITSGITREVVARSGVSAGHCFPRTCRVLHEKSGTSE